MLTFTPSLSCQLPLLIVAANNNYHLCLFNMAGQTADRLGVESASADSSKVQHTSTSTDTSIATANKQRDTSCALLDLPAEIRNRILNLVTPPGGLIILRAECSTAVDGTRKYRFRPPPPAISTTCKQLQAEINYDRTNNFVLSDSMFQPAAFKLFTELKKPAFMSVRRVRISTMLFTDKTPQATHLQYTFDVETTADGSSSLTRRGKRGGPEAVMKQVKDLHAGRQDGLCFCAIECLFSGSETLFEQLWAFADAIADPEKYPGYKTHWGITCAACRKTKLL